MLTFLLSPVVARMERRIGRIAAVLIVVVMLFGIIGGTGWLLTRQVIDLATKLPDYQTNIETKLRAVRLPIGQLTHSVNKIQEQLPNVAEPSPGSPEAVAETKRGPRPGPTPLPVRVIESSSRWPVMLQSVAAGLLGPLGRAGLVLLLVVFMLFKREDLRGRLIRLIVQGRIGATTRALDDAGKRVARYLGMQFLVNVSFGICISIGLYFIGVPNAMLWGAFAALMRFIPYIGAWIAAALPFLLSFAVTSNWIAPALVLALFRCSRISQRQPARAMALRREHRCLAARAHYRGAFLDVVMGTSRAALVHAAHGLPRGHGAACIAFAIPQRAPSEDEALAPHEEIYYRLLRLGLDEATHLAETFVKENSLTALYDTV